MKFFWWWQTSDKRKIYDAFRKAGFQPFRYEAPVVQSDLDSNEIIFRGQATEKMVFTIGGRPLAIGFFFDAEGTLVGYGNQ